MRPSVILLIVILLFSCTAICQERFLEDSNGTITDTLTGLQWCIGPDEPYGGWNGANDWVNGLSDGWELPSILQLQDLYEAGINANNWGLFENKGFTGTWVWSNALVGTFAWRFNFYVDSENVGVAERVNANLASAFRYGRAFAVKAGFDRFITGSGIVVDSQTNLEWYISPDGFCEENEVQKLMSELGEGWRLPTLEELESIYIAGITSASMAPFSDIRHDLHFESGVLVWCKSPYGQHEAVFDFFSGEQWIPGSMGYSALSVIPIAVRDH
ncbi:MAG: hypothetical protein KAR40_17865 [Candidatus Sabulitectum sp.]|nr:hypothetical protein [Candidatus Sabulitectum sp.]